MAIAGRSFPVSEVVMEIEADQTRVMVPGLRPTVKTFPAETIDATAIPKGVKRARVVSSFREGGYSIQMLPGTRGRTLDIVVNKAAQRVVPGKPIQARYRVLGREGDQNTVFLAAVPVSDLEWVGSRLRFMGLSARMIVPYAVAISNLVNMCRYNLRSDQALAFAEVRGHDINLVLLRGEGVAVYRRITAEGVPPGAPLETLAWVRLSQEILQTFLYFRQRWHGTDINRLILTGDPVDADAEAQIRDALGITVEALQIPPEIPFPREFVCRYPSLVSLALTEPGFPIAFNVPSMEEERRARTTQLAMSSLIGGLIIINVFGFGFLKMKQNYLAARVRLLEETQERYNRQISILKENVALLPVAEAYAKIYDDTKVKQPHWAIIFKEVESALPLGARLTRMDIKRTGDRWAVSLSGVSVDTSVRRVFMVSEATRKRLQISPLFTLKSFTRDKPQFEQKTRVSERFKAELVTGRQKVEQEEALEVEI
ncbi:MAG: hypothetical protein V2G42_01925 [bacterium JZ-2024 1]